MLNSNIRFDLHIHSFASAYKEPNYQSGESIVGKSTINNVNVLLNKLLDHNISLFSITDHNRYDKDLYKVLIDKCKEKQYKTLNLLHGIEFDVKLDKNKSTTHIISIFDVNNEHDMASISEAMYKNQLLDKNDFFTKEKFEKLLKEIGLNTILIVHQHCNLENKDGRHNSLSEAINNPYEIIKIGYINALEYQKPNVEGILKNNLRDVDTNIALITGSDCHDWNHYPKHDANSKILNDYFSKCKILPTFKGLLLGLTSPKTRFNRNEKYDNNYIKSFDINDKNVSLDPGINAIIGENGSGKSTLFNILGNRNLEQYIKKLKKKNKINVKKSNLKTNVIQQAELIEKFKNGDLFEESELFNEIEISGFEKMYEDFSACLKKEIETNIRKNESINQLMNKNFYINTDLENIATLYISIVSDNLSEEINFHTERRKKLANILELLITEYENDYYSDEEKTDLYNLILEMKKIYDSIEKRENLVDINNKIKNIITNEVNEYVEEIRELSSSEDQEIHDYKENKTMFSNSIIEAIKLNTLANNNLCVPSIMSGESQKRYNGYVFTREMNFNKIDVSEKFFEFMFIKKYNTLSKIANIKFKEELKKALYGCTDIEKIDEIWISNFEKFMKWAKEQKSYIKEETTNDSVGNTLGEMSLVYYKFQSGKDKECDVLMIDQPEDNISNNRIAQKLILYLNRTRFQKQVIIVTHNPLLVVNLDVDNVIYLNKINDTINVTAGCLEDENILNLVAQTLDGGKDMIKKRLNVYE